MLDANLIAALETSLRQTRNTQSRLLAKLRELESETEQLREEITILENTAEQTASAIDTLLIAMRSGSRGGSFGKTLKIEDDYDRRKEIRSPGPKKAPSQKSSPGEYRNANPIAYINQNRGLSSRSGNIEPISHRFSDRTITQACTLLLRESGKPLHVNELYHLLVAGGMQFKGNNPTISVAVSLNRNRRFRKVGPGTFDLVMREASQAAS